MAQFNIGLPNTRTRLVLRDFDGSTIMQVGCDEYAVVHPDGSITQHRINDNILLVDGMAWNAGMLRERPPLLIGRCADCFQPRFFGLNRDPATHGLVLLTRARLCTCGRLCCPRHRRQSPDGKWRCRQCDLKYRIKELIKSLFFTCR